jgi:hypothetical protein
LRNLGSLLQTCYICATAIGASRGPHFRFSAKVLAPVAAHTNALQHCYDEVADSAPMALERCLKHVISVLQDAEGTSLHTAERLELGEAWRELSQHQAAWCKRYPDELRAAFIAARAPTDEHPRAASAASGFGAPTELSLVEDADILEAIESSRLVHHVMPLVERPVSELDALVSSAMGLETVRPDLNPIRPEVFAQGLRALIGRTQVKAATGSLWMKYMAEPLGHELQDLYGRLVTQLQDANVQAAEYRLVQAKAGRRGGTSKPAESAGPAAEANTSGAHFPASYASLSTQEISHALLRDFLFNGREQASQALPDSYYAEVDRELGALANREADQEVSGPAQLPAGYREIPAVDRPQRTLGVQSALNAQVWGDYARARERSMVRSRLRKDATRVAQVLGLELVRKVVDQVARDPRLLAPVREAIVALEPSLLRLAMVDPRFFSEEHHAGRRLMEQVAQRSFKYNDEFSSEFAGFFDVVTSAFKELNQATIEDTRPFEHALHGLEATWTGQDQQEKEQRVHAVDAMRFAELRQAEADRIACELSSRPDLDAVPSVIQDFLFGPWALVIAHARLTDKDKQIDPHGYLSVISDLLWSVKREVTLRQPAQLFERVPRLVATLRAGLASLGQEREENEAFFQVLMKLHHPVLKLRRAKSRRDARESGMLPLVVVDTASTPLAAAPAKPAAGQPWMSPQELDAAGFQDTLPAEMADLLEATESTPAPLSASPEPGDLPATPAGTATTESSSSTGAGSESMLTELREGDWVDLYSKRRWLRAQLIWASTRGTLFMFVSHGGRPHSMTKRVCERLIRDRYLRPVRMHGVVARALGALDQEPAGS